MIIYHYLLPTRSITVAVSLNCTVSEILSLVLPVTLIQSSFYLVMTARIVLYKFV